MAKWKDVIASVAPTLATAFGGPLAGVAASVAGRALLGKGGDIPVQEIADFISLNQNPETLLALKEAEAEFLVRMEELGLEHSRIEAMDRSSARQRETATGDPMVVRLAGTIFVGFFGVLAAFIFVPIPTDALQPLNIMLGTLSTLIVQVGAYYFGSSRGSKEKTKLLGK